MIPRSKHWAPQMFSWYHCQGPWKRLWPDKDDFCLPTTNVFGKITLSSTHWRTSSAFPGTATLNVASCPVTPLRFFDQVQTLYQICHFLDSFTLILSMADTFCCRSRTTSLVNIFFLYDKRFCCPLTHIWFTKDVGFFKEISMSSKHLLVSHNSFHNNIPCSLSKWPQK